MRRRGTAALLAPAAAAVLLAALAMSQAPDGGHARTYLERSVPYVGGGQHGDGALDGTGITVAVIDTGVDHTHPDLAGRVAGGYNFVAEGEPPFDTDGHGTQVAGIIAADGMLRGVAPGAGILAYKVSEDGEGVSSDYIVRALRMAVEDGADVINISLGVNRTNPLIERAISEALGRGAVVVAAAGNDGPMQETIGSPGGNHGAITVGATHNNLTSSLIATLDAGNGSYTAVPMDGSPRPDLAVSGKLVHGGFGRPHELGDKVRGSVLVVERGTDTPGELLYFSLKESHAADAGAAALLVYNNEPGLFLGELIHEFSDPGYEPRIPVVSLGREEGLEVAERAGRGETAHLALFFNPDHVAHFSSRGPVSPFYIKPDIVAPGAFINTTGAGAGYNFTSGTSYAAPHVSGAAALLLQGDPGLGHAGVKSLLLTTASPVSDPRGDRFAASDAGSGRLDVAAALSASLLITPPSFVAATSGGSPLAVQDLSLRPLGGAPAGAGVRVAAPGGVAVEHSLADGMLRIIMDASGAGYGTHEGSVAILHGGINHTVPFLIHHTEGTVEASQEGGRLRIGVSHPDPWTFAKITVSAGDGSSRTTTAAPGRQASVPLLGPADHWVEARILAGGATSAAYAAVPVEAGDAAPPAPWDPVPWRQVGIIAGVVAAFGAACAALRGPSGRPL